MPNVLELGSKVYIIITYLFKKNKRCPKEDSLKLHKCLILLNNKKATFTDAPTDAPNHIIGLCYAIDAPPLLGSGSVKVLA